MVDRVAVLGATGSIGESTLDLIGQHPDRFQVAVLTAHRQVDKMLALAHRFLPQVIVMTDSTAAQQLREQIEQAAWAKTIDVLTGPEALVEAATDPSISMVVAGIVGAAGLPSAIAAAAAGKKILLANKEALVMAGSLFVTAAKKGQAVILPIDSEHNAIFQCLGTDYRCFERPNGVTRLLLTASGGPFRRWDKQAIQQATVAQAIAHPNWSMGRKISVDSATMMNKGLELIEAHWLFDMPEPLIDIVVHPQSVVHSMVEFADGSTLAQMGSPDMRTPIACAMRWPERMSSTVAMLDWRSVRTLEFEPPDEDRFPSLALARQTLRVGGAASAILNAANEVAVETFLAERMAFGGIFQVVEKTLASLSHRWAAPESLEALLALDAESRAVATTFCEQCT
jgi:1-deoxy-D-xylulose-5-phosphate reductoisomerase